MPHDLFGDADARPTVTRSRRPSLVFLSVCLHAGLLVLAIAASIVAPDSLPFPRKVLAFYEPVAVRLVDIDLPTPRRLPRTAAAPSDPSSPSAAPVVAPVGIMIETGRENFVAPAGDVPGSLDAVPGGTVVSELAPVPPTPTPAPAPPVRLHPGIWAPVKIVDITPVYPRFALQTHTEGVVILEATIDVAGEVQAARVLRSVPLLDQAALDAVHQWRYEPAQLNGQPIAVIMTITMRFALQ